MSDLEILRRRIAGLAPHKRERRYDAELRHAIAACARAHPELGLCALAGELDMAPQTLSRILAEEAVSALVPVAIVDDERKLVVRAACGLVVEGLGVGDVAALIRALS